MEKNIIDMLLGMQAPTPKAHEQMDALIGQNEIQNLLAGSTYESDPGILSEHTSLLNYLSGAVSEEGQQQYAYGIDEAGLQERMANIAKFPSFESRGVKRFTAPIMQDDGSVIKESRSMEHWLQDYDYLFNRTALSKP